MTKADKEQMVKEKAEREAFHKSTNGTSSSYNGMPASPPFSGL